MMMHYAEERIAIAGVVQDKAYDSNLPSPEPVRTRTIKDLKGCLAGRRPPPTAEEIRQAVAQAEESDNKVDPTISLGLPPLEPGQTCSVKALAGCLAGRRKGPAPTQEELEEAIAEAVWSRYLRSFG